MWSLKRGITMKNVVITIARHFGSGGKTIGKMLSEDLGISYYEHEIIEMASEESGIAEELFNQADEKLKRTPLFFGKSHSGEYKGKLIAPDSDEFVSDHNLFNYQAKIIRELADKESCIIVGRCADSVLESYPNVISVFIRANHPERVKRIMERQNISAKEAETLIKKMDKDRSLYYNFFSDKKWGRAESYDLVLNSTALGRERCVDLICSLMKQL